MTTHRKPSHRSKPKSGKGFTAAGPVTTKKIVDGEEVVIDVQPAQEPWRMKKILG